MTEHLEVKVTISAPVKVITDPLRSKITVSASFAKRSSVLVKHFPILLESLPETLNACPLKRWLHAICVIVIPPYITDENFFFFFFLMQIFASDLFGSTTKIAFLKISPNLTGWKSFMAPLIPH